MAERVAPGQINSVNDLMPYLSKMVPHLLKLGIALECTDYATAIIDNPGSQEDKCIKILQNWLNCTPRPTWDLFCTRLETQEKLANLADKIRDHESTLQPSSVSSSAKQREQHGQQEDEPDFGDHEPGDDRHDSNNTVRFAIVTANSNEWESTKCFMTMGEHMNTASCDLDETLKKKIRDLNIFNHIQSEGISAEITERVDTYWLVTVCNVKGVLVKCTEMGSEDINASGDTVKELLDTAEDKGWKLEAVFLVGCCGCACSKESKVTFGSVLIADELYQYKGRFTPDEMKLSFRKPLSINADWVKFLYERSEAPFEAKLKVKKVFKRPLLSGDFLMKDGERAEHCRVERKLEELGFEMEGSGAHRTISREKRRWSNLALLVVKGVSDAADKAKNASAPITFFDEMVENMAKHPRQQMCTFMSLMVVCRAIKAKWSK